MKDPEIKSSSRTRWANQRESVAQPNGIDYSQLVGKINEKPQAQDMRGKKVESSVGRKDLRRKSYKIEDLNKDEDSSLADIDQKSIIPVPGMLIDPENSGSDTRPPDSDWIAPHGPQWGPMTQ